MSLEPGGYGDKLGNRYERLWTVKQFLLLLQEQVESVVIEPVGEDESGADLWVAKKGGGYEIHQCKAENGPVGRWSMADLIRNSVIRKGVAHLRRRSDVQFHFVSADSATDLRDLSRSARDSDGNAESFYQSQVSALGEHRRAAFTRFCTELGLEESKPRDRREAFQLLSRIHVDSFSDDSATRQDILSIARVLVSGRPEAIVASLHDLAASALRRAVTCQDVVAHLTGSGFHIRPLLADNRVSSKAAVLVDTFQDSMRSLLVGGQMLCRSETKVLLDAVMSDDPPAVIVVHGDKGVGKSGVLFELSVRLQEAGVTHIPLRLDRVQLPSGTSQLGADLGLPDSPVLCLHGVASSVRPSVLILDQLDALRWTNASSLNGVETCKRLISEVRACRAVGSKVVAVLCCRTYDLHHDPSFREWIQATSVELLHLQVMELSLSVVEDIVRKAKVDPTRLAAHRLELLRNIQHLSMWSEIVRSDERSPDFDSATQLLRSFWVNRRREIEKTGVSVSDREAVLTTLLDYMEQHATLSAPLSIIELNSKLMTEFCTSAVITISGRTVSFAHQSYLDFLIAERILRRTGASGLAIIQWLGDKSIQTLFRREQLRQTLLLIAHDRPAELVSTADLILRSPEVRFHLKHVTLAALGQITPDARLTDYVCQLLSDRLWRPHISTELLWRNREYTAALIGNGVLWKWLVGTDDADRSRAFWQLANAVNDLPGPVAGIFHRLLSVDESHASAVQGALLSSPDEESVEIFRVRLRCCRIGMMPEYIPWEKVIAKRPKRAIALLVESLRTGFSGTEGGWGDVVKGDKEFRGVAAAASRSPRFAWSRLINLLVHVHRSGAKNSFVDNFGWRLPRVFLVACVAAGRRIANRSPGQLLRAASKLQARFPSAITTRLLANSFVGLPRKYSDRILRWLMDDDSRLRCGERTYMLGAGPARRMIRRFSASCSDHVYAELQRRLLAYRDPSERRLAKGWLRDARAGWFNNQFLAAQYVLLPSLSKRRRSLEVVSRIGVLNRKFESMSFSRSGARSQGGFVHSPLDRSKIDAISNSAWLRICTNAKIPMDRGRWRTIKGVGDALSESSVSMFSRDLEFAASREPLRFVKLALEFPDAVPQPYYIAVLSAAGLCKPPTELSSQQKEQWQPAPLDLVEQLHRKAGGSGDEDAAKAFLWSLLRRNDVPLTPFIVSRLAECCDNSDPASDELTVNSGQRASTCSVADLELNAINCVRGLAAMALARLVSDSPGIFPVVGRYVDRLQDDPNAVVRFAMSSICRSLWNVNNDESVKCLQLAAAKDLRCAASQDSRYMYNFMFPQYAFDLRPIICGMLVSEFDDVSNIGAAQCTARFIFHGLFENEVEECISGKVPVRKGVADVAAQLAAKPESMSRALKLIVRLVNDESEAVINEVNSLDFSALIGDPEAVEFLKEYTISAAFRSNPRRLLRSLENFGGPVDALKEVLGLACSAFVEASRDGVGVQSGRRGYSGRMFSPILLRLYEQAEAGGDVVTRSFCLDAWDSLLEHQIENALVFGRELQR